MTTCYVLIPHWPLLLPPLATSTSPSRSCRSSSSIAVEELSSRRPLPSSCRRAFHRRRAAPSITVKLPSRCLLPSIAVVLEVHCHLARDFPRCPSPSRSRHAVHCRRAAPSITVKLPPSIAVNSSKAFIAVHHHPVHCR